MRKIKLISLFVLGGALLLPFLTSAATIEEMQSQIAALLKQISALQVQINQQRGNTATSTDAIMPVAPETGNTWCYDFKRSLKVGAKGEDVAALQAALEKEGVTISDTEQAQGVYGTSTVAAVAKFQEKNKETIKGFSDPTARGIFGPQTRGVMGSIRGCRQADIKNVCAFTTQVIPQCNADEKLIVGLKDSNGCAVSPRCVPITTPEGGVCAKEGEALRNPSLGPDREGVDQSAKPTVCCGDLKPVSPAGMVGAAPVCRYEQKNPEQMMCGGIAGKTCSDGFTCKLDGDYPDASGKCVSVSFPKVPVATTTPPIYACPMYAIQPAPGFCTGGKITYPKDSYGCSNRPVCEYAGIATTTPPVYPINPTPKCVVYSAPSPDFCMGGKIITGLKNDYGCQLPPRCERETTATTSTSY